MQINPQTLFLFSTSGSQSSLEKHNKALQSLSANLMYFTFSHPISAEEYAQLLQSPISRGGAVTGQGLKSGIMPFLKEVDVLAKATGAVNTVVNRNGRLYGYNTDAFGFESAVKSHIEKTGFTINKAIIYGNGGVSGVATHVLKSMGIQVTMTGRNQKRVQDKMQALGLDFFKGPYDLVVNATPISTFPMDQVTELTEVLRHCKMVFDHNMPEKDHQFNYLKSYAQENNLYFIPGQDMYIPQMIKQWTLFLNGALKASGSPMDISEEDIRKHWNI